MAVFSVGSVSRCLSGRVMMSALALGPVLSAPP